MAKCVEVTANVKAAVDNSLILANGNNTINEISEAVAVHR